MIRALRVPLDACPTCAAVRYVEESPSLHEREELYCSAIALVLTSMARRIRPPEMLGSFCVRHRDAIGEALRFARDMEAAAGYHGNVGELDAWLATLDQIAAKERN